MRDVIFCLLIGSILIGCQQAQPLPVVTNIPSAAATTTQTPSPTPTATPTPTQTASPTTAPSLTSTPVQAEVETLKETPRPTPRPSKTPTITPDYYHLSSDEIIGTVVATREPERVQIFPAPDGSKMVSIERWLCLNFDADGYPFMAKDFGLVRLTTDSGIVIAQRQDHCAFGGGSYGRIAYSRDSQRLYFRSGGSGGGMCGYGGLEYQYSFQTGETELIGSFYSSPLFDSDSPLVIGTRMYSFVEFDNEAIFILTAFDTGEVRHLPVPLPLQAFELSAGKIVHSPDQSKVAFSVLEGACSMQGIYVFVLDLTTQEIELVLSQRLKEASPIPAVNLLAWEDETTLLLQREQVAELEEGEIRFYLLNLTTGEIVPKEGD